MQFELSSNLTSRNTVECATMLLQQHLLPHQAPAATFLFRETIGIVHVLVEFEVWGPKCSDRFRAVWICLHLFPCIVFPCFHVSPFMKAKTHLSGRADRCGASMLYLDKLCTWISAHEVSSASLSAKTYLQLFFRHLSVHAATRGIFLD